MCGKINGQLLDIMFKRTANIQRIEQCSLLNKYIWLFYAVVEQLYKTLWGLMLCWYTCITGWRKVNSIVILGLLTFLFSFSKLQRGIAFSQYSFSQLRKWNWTDEWQHFKADLITQTCLWVLKSPHQTKRTTGHLRADIFF